MAACEMGKLDVIRCLLLDAETDPSLTDRVSTVVLVQQDDRLEHCYNCLCSHGVISFES